MPASAQPPVFLFVVGSGRSGSTMLRAMLDAHPDLAIAHEAHFVAALGRRPDRYDEGAAFAADRFLADLFAHGKFSRFGLSPEDVRAVFDPPPLSYPEAVRRVFATYALQQGKTRYGDKTPGYVLRVPMLAELFPEARFVHLVRDGRDVAISYTHAPFGPASIGEAAIYWKRRVTRGRRAGLALGGSRYREIHYEHLLDDTEGVLRQVCDFADLPFDPVMLRYYERADAAVGTTGHPEAHQSLRLPPTKGLRNWRHEMSPPDLVLFEAVAGGLLVDLGYELSTARCSLLGRANAQWHRLRWLRHRSWFHIRQLVRGRARVAGRE